MGDPSAATDTTTPVLCSSPQQPSKYQAQRPEVRQCRKADTVQHRQPQDQTVATSQPGPGFERSLLKTLCLKEHPRPS